MGFKGFSAVSGFGEGSILERGKKRMGKNLTGSHDGNIRRGVEKTCWGQGNGDGNGGMGFGSFP